MGAGRCFVPGVCAVLVAIFCASARAESVDDLAKEGHWLKGNAWETQKELIGKPAPKLEMSNWIGKEVGEKEMKDKIVVMDFWATWCGPCKAAVPHTNEIAKKYAEKGVIVVGACGGRGEENMPKVVEETKMEYPTAKVSAESTKAWAVQYWPHYVVVDRKGNIRAIGIKPDYVEKVVEALLAESEKK